MLPKDMNGKEFNYLDYVVYTDSCGNLEVAQISKIVISNTVRLICNILHGNTAILKRFDRVKIISKEEAYKIYESRNECN